MEPRLPLRAVRPPLLTLTLAAAAVLVPSAGAAGAGAAAAATDTARDPHSHSRPDQVAVTHAALDLTVDFAAKRLVGSAELTLERRAEDAKELVLDTNGLEIESVVRHDANAAKEPVKFALGEASPLLGRSLTIPIGAGTKRVTIRYRTGANAGALQWLEPAQTAGGKRPFLFTQSQPILARSWIPCQDSPGVRMTYTATLRVPADLMAVMSAENPQAKSADGVYRLALDKPIPSYLFSLAVGDLEFRALGPRSGVYAEPAVVAAAAHELADTESMITAAEKLYGPYRWGRYDLLVLPPSFPYGGMENPRLTFATPTILAGDRSLVSLIAHELAHSWSGNLVTNATWNDFWLNEGFTNYFENRIVEEVYGADRAGMLQQLELEEIDETFVRVGADNALTRLHSDLDDPDGYEAAIQYNKGAFFLRTVERTVGRAELDRFLRAYFDRHAFESMTTERFLAELDEQLLRAHQGSADRIGIQEWVYGTGLPKNVAVAASESFAKVDAELAKWKAGTPASKLDTKGWVTQQWQRFLGGLGTQTPEKLAELDAAFGFTLSGNSEILCDWFLIAIANDYRAADPAIERLLTSMGRRKFLRPIYTELAKTPAGLERAKAIYARARPTYHPVSQGTIDQILGWKG